MLTVMSRLGKKGFVFTGDGARENRGKLHLRAATKLPWILGEVSTSLGLASLSGNRTWDAPLLSSHSSCSSLQTGAYSLLDVFTRATWIWLSEKPGKMVFPRLAACFLHPNSEKQCWILASHFSCWSGKHHKDGISYVFFFLQITDYILPEWRQPKYGMRIYWHSKMGEAGWLARSYEGPLYKVKGNILRIVGPQNMYF